MGATYCPLEGKVCPDMRIAFKPPVAVPLTDLASLLYPMYLSPKVDGVRCAVHPGFGLITDEGDCIKNPHICRLLDDISFEDLDGVLIAGPPTGKDTLSRTATELEHGGEPTDVAFVVFDVFERPWEPYSRRIEYAKLRVAILKGGRDPRPWLHMLPQHLAEDARAMFQVYDRFLEQGFSGAVLRDPDGPYAPGHAYAVEPSEAVFRYREMVLRKQHGA